LLHWHTQSTCCTAQCICTSVAPSPTCWGNFLARPAQHKIDYKIDFFHRKKITNRGHPPLRFGKGPLMWSNFLRTFVMKKFDHINQKVRARITKRLLHTRFCNENWTSTLVICNEVRANRNRSRGFKCYRRKNIVCPRMCTIERLWCPDRTFTQSKGSQKNLTFLPSYRTTFPIYMKRGTSNGRSWAD
jgi:hypothetical protein